eukprot:664329-Amphidinium_carterae.1
MRVCSSTGASSEGAPWPPSTGTSSEWATWSSSRIGAACSASSGWPSEEDTSPSCLMSLGLRASELCAGSKNSERVSRGCAAGTSGAAGSSSGSLRDSHSRGPPRTAVARSSVQGIFRAFASAKRRIWLGVALWPLSCDLRRVFLSLVVAQAGLRSPAVTLQISPTSPRKEMRLSLVFQCSRSAWTEGSRIQSLLEGSAYALPVFCVRVCGIHLSMQEQ